MASLTDVGPASIPVRRFRPPTLASGAAADDDDEEEAVVELVSVDVDVVDGVADDVADGGGVNGTIHRS